ncbi:diguanylate cyclase/phosphodiesterase [Arcobacter venerupis]|uniref:Diguanylate cyclase/phosphodiesterase n=1 Tax=Arcobacter venerupis TaxID=1054033 RepID=A0AAE7BAZ1_9BACT|nr:bifunctional diguanylate cyclase/phosphodiesterase [Arcobacter venerupis]QKF68461.1 diguanylate cyclase/phosphodiesterase [Arcobacter venerupis]
MKKKITYNKLILKIILITLTFSLTIAFVYTHYMKKEAIEKLSKVDAKKTTELIFQTLYSAMERGWTKDDLNSIIARVNTVDKNMIVNVYRGEEVAKQFGDIQKDSNARKTDSSVQSALAKNEVLNIIDESTIEYYYPIIAKEECLKCHTQTQEGNVLGVINILYPIDDLKISLSSIINFFILFIILFSIVIFIALFIEFDRHLVKPIKNFIANINYISNNKDITKRVGTNNEITEIDSMQSVFNNMLDSLEYQFYHDELTTLPNRKKLIETLSSDKDSILMIINIDKFQHINDLYGDKIGNDIIRNTANIIKDNVSKEAILFKLHADEYAIYQPSDVIYEEIKDLALHLANCIENHTFIINENEIYVNATIGVAYGTSFLLHNADMALKLAKKTRKKYLIYNSSMNIEHEYAQNLKWSKKIKDAIENDKIEPLFQPIVDTKTSKIVKYEALIRMIDEDGEYVAPIHFLELAKKNKLYPKLTKIVIEKTFNIFKNIDAQVSINLSVQDILNEDVYSTIIQKLHEYKLGDKIVFELIESEGIENFDEIIEFISEVKKTGAKISIDDFGTGYSNFEYIMKLKVDYIKIDASMIKDIDKNINSQMVTGTIIDFAKKMDIQTIAEFVHSQSVFEVVKEMGIDFAQGYYFGKPQKLS